MVYCGVIAASIYIGKMHHMVNSNNHGYSPRLRIAVPLLRYLLFLAVALCTIPTQAQTDDYTLNSGDSIYVYGENDLTFDSLLIGQNGRSG